MNKHRYGFFKNYIKKFKKENKEQVFLKYKNQIIFNTNNCKSFHYKIS